VELTPEQQKLWEQVRDDLRGEPVASPDHVLRMTEWCSRLGSQVGADMETLLAGALVHDVGVPIERKTHYLVGRDRAREIMAQAGFPEETREAAVHVLEAHSRYGGPQPESLEARVGQDADALEYVGAIGIVRAVVRGLTDGSFDGSAGLFPDYLRALLGRLESTFHTEEAGEVGRARIDYMREFLARIERELTFEA
jgi:uncharacterized protein